MTTKQRLANLSTEDLRDMVAAGHADFMALSAKEQQRRSRYFPMIVAELERREG